MEKNLKQFNSDIIKVVINGPESTGKTTLIKQLAEYFNTEKGTFKLSKLE